MAPDRPGQPIRTDAEMKSSPDTIAAVDLGSNSFHMIVARTAGDHFRVVDRMREMVRLGAGVNAQNELTDEAVARALACLQRFGERLAELPRGAVRVVGTNTLRKAREVAAFIAEAEAALGHEVDVISGYEEARLIFLGVSHGLDDDAEQRLVMDIGGGSTELILGHRFEPLHMASLHMGCVSQSARFFDDGRIDAKRMRAAEIAAYQELEPILARYRRLGWQSAIGASGTILAIRDIVHAHGWSDEGISAESLAKLRREMIKAGHVDKLSLRGLSEERRPVFPGGVAILSATFEALGIEHLQGSESALREGLLYDLLGRIHEEDVRERAVADLEERYHLDVAQAARVAEAAESIRQQVGEAWALQSEEVGRLLRWAAQLHEIGLSISYSSHHKHGGYLLTHLDMPGFARGEQRRLATLVRAQRRKLPLPEFDRFPKAQARQLLRACVVLRIAATWNRRRGDEALPPTGVSADGSTLKLRYLDDWLDEHPLMRADLEQEAVYLKAAGFTLKFK
jgi:exopolyphosphatase/guanosine-5'-triphosphate,3'-diphosphate pyrophosphatase